MKVSNSNKEHPAGHRFCLEFLTRRGTLRILVGSVAVSQPNASICKPCKTPMKWASPVAIFDSREIHCSCSHCACGVRLDSAYPLVAVARRPGETAPGRETESACQLYFEVAIISQIYPLAIKHGKGKSLGMEASARKITEFYVYFPASHV